MIYWSGIPCAHLLFIILRFKGSIVYYINSRWLNPTPYTNRKNKVEVKVEGKVEGKVKVKVEGKVESKVFEKKMKIDR